MDTDERKEEKIALARQKLKQFKKESAKSAHHQLHHQNHHQNQQHQAVDGSQNTNSSLSHHLIQLNTLNGDQPHSETYSERSTPSSLKQQTPETFESAGQPQLQFSAINLGLNEHALSQTQFKEQLQLHVQTIGILVAEKAELQSKLQQQSKKSDKKQEECDELAGRLKASRHKIGELEKLVAQLNEANEANEGRQNEAIESEQVRNAVNSRQLVIDELRMRLDESDARLAEKHQESEQLARLTLDLKSQLEIMQLRVIQMNAANANANAAADSGNQTKSSEFITFSVK